MGAEIERFNKEASEQPGRPPWELTEYFDMV
jgi:hypothetical protein